MSTTDERLEMRIGRLLDGELSPAERHSLESELDRDPQARELLERMQALHECGREIVDDELSGGAATSQVFSRACRASGRSVGAGGRWRFVTGLAAGFLLGLAVHFLPVGKSPPVPDPHGSEPVAMGPRAGIDNDDLADEMQTPDAGEHVIRRVDWFGFTDEQGNHWLVEGIRENPARPGVHYTSL